MKTRTTTSGEGGLMPQASELVVSAVNAAANTAAAADDTADAAADDAADAAAYAVADADADAAADAAKVSSATSDDTYSEQEASTASSMRGKEAETSQERQFLDGGYGWVIVVCCFLLNMIKDGLLNAFGVIYIEVLERFDTTSAEAAWILSLQMCIHGLVGPVVIALNEFIGTRITTVMGSLLIASGLLWGAFATSVYTLYLSLGLLVGLGFGVYDQFGAGLVNLYFDKRRGIANGITTAGTGVGLLVFPPLTEYMFFEYGYSGTCILLSCIALQGIVAGVLMLSPEDAIRTANTFNKSHESMPGVDNRIFVIDDGKIATTKQEIPKTQSVRMTVATKDSTLTFKGRLHKAIRSSCNLPLFKDITFACFAFTHCLYFGGFIVPSAFMPARAVSLGISKIHASLLISAMGISSLLTRPISGLLVDIQPIKRNRFYVFFAMAAMSGCVSIVSFGSTLEAQVAYASLYGFSTGGYISLVTVTLGDLVGVEKLMSAYAMAGVCMTLPALVIPTAAGFIFDATGRYEHVYAFGGSILLLAAGVLMLIPIKRKNACSKKI